MRRFGYIAKNPPSLIRLFSEQVHVVYLILTPSYFYVFTNYLPYITCFINRLGGIAINPYSLRTEWHCMILRYYP